ncbi:hypothetical protein M8C21_029057 [Ambrosia artemisiifolia]|uniref:Uncharacterized protein n=1 Tax=Ambrosia artemisiifolia TaxID=4212 RepID=A0AAD5C155_AMBAR|nr:hypothetical protein M8C21_029057 [Ambrosia artemisiifolia]
MYSLYLSVGFDKKKSTGRRWHSLVGF